MSFRSFNASLYLSVLVFATLLMQQPAAAQDETAAPKWDVFVGYQWLSPNATIPSPTGTPANPLPVRMGEMKEGAGVAVTRNFGQIWGLEFDFGRNGKSGNTLATASLGPRLMWRQEYASFFAHSLLSYSRQGIPGFDGNNGVGGIIGGGFDLKAGRWISWRVFEADWMPSAHHINGFFPSSIGHPNMNSARLRTGIVMNFGYEESKPVGATVTVQPAQSMVGEP